MAEGQIAVLIDVENVGLSPVQELFDQLANVGRIIVKRAYGDWSGTRARDRDRLQGLGIDPIQVFHSGTGKNSADIRLAIDAIELSFQSPVETFVVVSSDSDFVPLVGKLRAAGKTVIGAGPSAVASRTLVGSCDRYFYLDPKTASATEPAPEESRDVGLLVRAVRASMDDDGRCHRQPPSPGHAAPRSELRLQGVGALDIHEIPGGVAVRQRDPASRKGRRVGQAARVERRGRRSGP